MDQVNNLLHIIEVNIEAWDNVEKPAPTKERAQFILSLVAEEVEPVSDLSDGVQMIAKEMVETHDGVLMTFASRLSALLAAHPSPQASPDAGEKCPIFIAEKYADNGALSHWDVIVKDTGDTVASYPPDDHPTDAGEWRGYVLAQYKEIPDAHTFQEEIARLKDVLRCLDRQGGLGFDNHGMIRAALDKQEVKS